MKLSTDLIRTRPIRPRPIWMSSIRMRSIRPCSIRFGLTAAVACSALAVPASALAAPSPASQVQASRAAARIAPCKSFNTAVWLGLGNGGGALGTTFYPLEFSNIGHRTCALFGYPGVSAVTAGGRQIGLPASHSGRARLVVLRPGSTAHAILGIIVAGNIGGCHIRNGALLKVFAPGQRASQVIAGFTFAACSNKSVLRVGAVHPGTGIPGFTTS
jgi:hypothetical protein